MTLIDDRTIAQNVAARIIDLRQLVPKQASVTQVRAATVWVRDIYENLDRMWPVAGLAGAPGIHSCAFEWDAAPPDVFASLWGHLARINDGPLISPSGQPGIHYEWTVASGDTPLPDWTMGGDPFIERVRGISEYFGSCILRVNGMSVSRTDVLEYAAYRRGFIHAEGDRYIKRNPATVAILDKAFGDHGPEYAILTIVQELLVCEDVDRFRAAALSLSI